MTEQEGVIKYHVHHQVRAIENVAIDWQTLTAHREQLHRLQLIGQQADRYGGLGYGNISQRLKTGSPDFVISGSQTGHLPKLTPADFAWVKSADINSNQITSQGLLTPSSEALSHASIYQCRPQTMAVIHVHSPELWHNCRHLKLPHTAANIAYGTVEMARAIQALCLNHSQNTLVFCMLGHEDGVIAYGDNLSEAALALSYQYQRALACSE